MLPLATDEIRKLNAFKFFLKMNAMNAFCFIPLDEESEKPMAFQMHEGLLASSRLAMGCHPPNQSDATDCIPYSYGQVYTVRV